jgi:transposase InsO family protein
MAFQSYEAESLVSRMPEPTNDNFMEWNWSLKRALMLTDVWACIFARDTEGERPSPDDNIYYTKHAKRACSLISGAAGAKNARLTDPFCDVCDPIGMYDAIVSKYSTKTASTRFKGLLKMMGIRKEPGEEWESTIERIESALANVTRLVPDTTTAEAMLSEFALFVLINCIDSGDATRRSILGSSATSFALAKSTIINEENTSPGQIAAATSQVFAVANAATASHSYPSEVAAKIEFADRVQNNSKCFFCSKTGHSIRNCHKYSAAREACLSGQRTGSHAQPQPGQPAITPNFQNNNNNARGGRGRGGGNRSKNNGFIATVEEVPTEFAGAVSTFRSPSLALPDQWTADSGASASMTPRKDWFSSMVSDRRAVRLADGATIWSEGRGVATFIPVVNGQSLNPIEFHDVLFVPDLSHNLLSIIRLTKYQNYTMTMDAHRMTFLRSNHVTFVATITDTNVAYADGTTVCRPPTTETAAVAETASAAVSLERWHHRLGHSGYARIKGLIKSGVVRDFEVSNASIPADPCEDCIMGKMTRAPHTKAAERATEPLGRIFSDVKGPMTVRGRHGEEYWVVFEDQYTGMVMVYFLERKGQLVDAFKRFAAYAENQMNARILRWDEVGIRKVIKILRDDKGGEYSSHALRDFCDAHGIAREHTIRDTPQQNGLAERMNRTIADGVTSMMAAAKLPASSWPDAVGAYIHALNRLPSSTSGSMTPYELWNGRPPSLSHLRTWGCEALVHLQKDQRAQFAPHARRCVFIGYPPDYKGWKFLDLSTGKEVVSDSAVFYETKFPGKFHDKSAQKFDAAVSARLFLPAGQNVEADVTAQDPLAPVSADPSIVPGPVSANSDPPVDDPSNVPPLPVAPPPAPPPEPTAPPDPLPPPEEPAPPAPSREARILSNANWYEHFPHTLPPRRARNHVPGQYAYSAFLADAAESFVPPAVDEASEQACAFTAQDFEGSIFIPIVDGVEFALATSSNFEPKSLKEALELPDSDKWIDAALNEIKSLLDNKTWDIVPLPAGKGAIGSRWVFKIKKKSDGSIERYKGRLVAKGFLQKEGIDYTETFAPTVRLSAVRTVLALAALEDMELESVDVSSAFLNGELDESVYMKLPEGFSVDGDDGTVVWVLKLLKSLYGLKQAGRCWSKKLHEVLTNLGFIRTESEHSFYIYEHNGVKILVPVYVDDLTLASKSKSALVKLKADLASNFKIRDLGPTEFILGIKVERDRPNRTIYISQSAYIQSILDEHLPAPTKDMNSVRVPMLPDSRLSSEDSPQTPDERAKMSKSRYLEIIGKLLYIERTTRPDIAYALHVLCRFGANPGPKHLGTLRHLLRYIRKTTFLQCLGRF